MRRKVEVRSEVFWRWRAQPAVADIEPFDNGEAERSRTLNDTATHYGLAPCSARSRAHPHCHEILARHGYTQIVPKFLVVGDEITLQFLSALGVASCSDGSGWSVAFDE